MNSFIIRILAIAGMLAGAPTGGATESLRLEQAVARSLESSPLLRARAAELHATQARADREALPSPYYLAADLENVAGSGSLSGMESAEMTVRVGRILELGGKLKARRTLGDAEISLQLHEVAVARQSVSDLAARRFIEVLADQQRLELANELVALAERTRAEVSRFVESARNAESDLRLAEISLADAELEREHAEHELASARVTLAATWGSWQPDFDFAAGDLAALSDAEPLTALAARLSQSPQLQRRSLEQRIAGARRGLAAASAHPDVNVSLGVRRLEAFGDHGLVLGASLPLGNGSRARLTANALAAETGALDAHRDHDLADAQQSLFEKYQEFIHARTEFEALQGRMIPKAEQALSLARQAFERGRLPLTSLLQAQALLHDLRRRRVDAAAHHHELLIELRRIAGPDTGESP